MSNGRIAAIGFVVGTMLMSSLMMQGPNDNILALINSGRSVLVGLLFAAIAVAVWGDRKR